MSPWSPEACHHMARRSHLLYRTVSLTDKYRSISNVHVVAPKALVAGLLLNVPAPNAPVLVLGCPNRFVFDAAGWDGPAGPNVPPPPPKAVVPPPPNAPNPVAGFVAPNIDGLLVLPPNAPSRVASKKKVVTGE